MKKLCSTIIAVSKIAKGFLALVAVAVLSVVLPGCSDDLNDLAIPENEPGKSATVSSYTISKGEAMEIAVKVLKKPATRNGECNMPVFEYVLNERHTRSSFAADTLAYVLNYPDDGGFVIVSTDNRVYPVLAFSDKGNFSFENEIAKANFIDNIGAYIEENASDSIYEVSDEDFVGCYIVQPMVQISLSQESPWNKYVVEEHPGCPAGCAAVATALVMSHARDTMTYHNTKFYLKSMITAINKGQNPPDPGNNQVTVGGLPLVNPIAPTYTYEQAVDSMAKLLYWIGKDVNTTYTTVESIAFPSKAYELCKSLDFIIPSGYAKFDIKEVVSYLHDNHIVFIVGYKIDEKGGHGWISDACRYCVNPNDRSEITNTYIHCDWGWGGNGNGYYSGPIFEVSGSKFSGSKFFAVKRGTKLSFGEGVQKP